MRLVHVLAIVSFLWVFRFPPSLNAGCSQFKISNKFPTVYSWVALDHMLLQAVDCPGQLECKLSAVSQWYLIEAPHFESNIYIKIKLCVITVESLVSPQLLIHGYETKGR